MTVVADIAALEEVCNPITSSDYGGRGSHHRRRDAGLQCFVAPRKNAEIRAVHAKTDGASVLVVDEFRAARD